jgi:hypothetical protein
VFLETVLGLTVSDLTQSAPIEPSLPLRWSFGLKMGPSKNILNKAPKKIGRLDQMKVFSVLIIVMTLVYVFLIKWYRELGRPIFLEAIFGLTQMSHTKHSTE